MTSKSIEDAVDECGKWLSEALESLTEIQRSEYDRMQRFVRATKYQYEQVLNDVRVKSSSKSKSSLQAIGVGAVFVLLIGFFQGFDSLATQIMFFLVIATVALYEVVGRLENRFSELEIRLIDRDLGSCGLQLAFIWKAIQAEKIFNDPNFEFGENATSKQRNEYAKHILYEYRISDAILKTITNYRGPSIPLSAYSID